MTPTAKRRSLLFRVSIIVAPLLGLVLVSFPGLFADYIPLRANWSDSLSYAGFVRVPGSPKKGDIVMFCLDGERLREAVDVVGVPFPELPPCGHLPLFKIYAAGPGDLVTFTPDAVFINGVAWPETKQLASTPSGSPLRRFLPSGPHRLGSGEFLPLGLHPNSWDGRYLGPLPESTIRGRWLGVGSR